MLSSFLITNLLLREREEFGRIDVRAFYVRRALRIWPLYFFVLAIVTAKELLQAGRIDPLVLLGYVGFFGNRLVMLRPVYYNILWSISVEEQFYLLSPFVLRRLHLIRPVGWALVALALAYRMAMAAQGAEWKAFWFSSFAHVDAFALGALASVWLEEKGSSSLRLPLGAASFLLAATLATVSYTGPLLDRSSHPGFLAATFQTAVPFAMALLVLALAKSDDDGFLASPPLVYLGRISFGRYLYHLMVMEKVLPIASHFPVALYPAFVILSLAITMAAAAISYRWIEKPFLRLKERFAYVGSTPV